jgi:hypothetical protein
MYVLTEVKVKNANRELLHEALKLLAEHEGFAVSDFDTNPELFVMTKGGGRKLVEVEVGKDEIKVRGDSDFISRQELNGLAQMVKQYYVAVATVATLRRSSYSSVRVARAGENLYVEAI